MDGHGERQNRLERRKQRTRAALIKAAQTFIAAGKPNVPVLDITQAADVGMGSFYNHFDSKEQLFQAAVTDVFDAYGAVLDSLPEVGSSRDVCAQLSASRSFLSAPPAGMPCAAQCRHRTNPVGPRSGAAGAARHHRR